MEKDCFSFFRKCHQCQGHGDLIHAPPSELHPMSAPWPFVAWGMDVIGPIETKASNMHKFILVAIDYFTKWVEAVTLKAVTKKAITHRNSTPYRPKTNGVVEAVNKNIQKILRKMIQSSRHWHEKLPFALLGYGTTMRTSVRATPYLLVYGTESVIPAEVEIPSLRIIVEAEIEDNEWAQQLAIAQLQSHPRTPSTAAPEIAPPVKRVLERSSNNGSVADPAIVKILEDLTKRIKSRERMIAANDKKVKTYNCRVDQIPGAPPILKGLDSKKII
ncbi:uncharacterized protein [Nicotiana sylvestris]|uniref:uncharacterized protein n=1 Tax=Nicotiana sylvestris TaxID=4096 RepID=UPI00388CCC5C